jgi:hypothetical protein
MLSFNILNQQMENVIAKEKNILVVLQEKGERNAETRELIDNFCGKVVTGFSDIQGESTEKRIYVCGDVSAIKEELHPVYIIKELSTNYENNTSHVVTLGQVPIVISNAGVYFRKLFTDNSYFDKIKSEHAFQELTESNKPSKAFRKGIYLTKVTKAENEEGNEVLHYRLLRCSSNLTGPTDNFRATDHQIIDTLNDAVKYVFEYKTELNHVLAQIYENRARTEDNDKEVKSRIKAHCDKTKDMPKEGLIVFCTFYDNADLERIGQQGAGIGVLQAAGAREQKPGCCLSRAYLYGECGGYDGAKRMVIFKFLSFAALPVYLCPVW